MSRIFGETGGGVFYYIPVVQKPTHPNASNPKTETQAQPAQPSEEPDASLDQADSFELSFASEYEAWGPGYNSENSIP